ncbi:hypothetical protein MU582_00280 [Nocardioidaceae bacterium SCSIO 66511]|nr:hypothetical protein MU582_00280 [Nocardioidaceae bacterium SCSIO 66511]
MRRTQGRAVLAAVVAAGALVATAGSAYTDTDTDDANTTGGHHDGRRTAAVTGSAEFGVPFWPDKDVRSFKFDVHAKPYSDPKLPFAPKGLPTDAVGKVKISHWVAKTGETIHATAKVDCLATAPRTATFTAIVTKADEAVHDWIGRRVGWSVYDGGPRRGGKSRDRVSFSWNFSMDQNKQGKWREAKLGTCVAPAAFGKVTRGDYQVRHADLLPQPTS